tara:strand:- start:903 stop:1349 length:447 start_codon:yes stop_codon:yes gene_type:complete
MFKPEIKGNDINEFMEFLRLGYVIELRVKEYHEPNQDICADEGSICLLVNIEDPPEPNYTGLIYTIEYGGGWSDGYATFSDRGLTDSCGLNSGIQPCYFEDLYEVHCIIPGEFLPTFSHFIRPTLNYKPKGWSREPDSVKLPKVERLR